MTVARMPPSRAGGPPRATRRLGLVILLALPTAAAGFAISTTFQKLTDRGLTRREAECLEHRHRRRNRQKLTVEELDATLLALDELALLPGQVRHLLRSTPLPELRALCEEPSTWCSYRKTLCSCAPSGAAEGGTAAPAGREAGAAAAQLEPPRLLAFDCEFKPIRFAAVDEEGRVRLDGLVVSGAEVPPMPGVLSCDKPSLRRLHLAELQAELSALEAAGCTFVAHTPARDLEAIEMPDLRVVDVGRLGLAPETHTVSLQRMADAHLGLAIQRGGQAHCAVQDARVAMALYHAISSEMADGG